MSGIDWDDLKGNVIDQQSIQISGCIGRVILTFSALLDGDGL